MPATYTVGVGSRPAGSAGPTVSSTSEVKRLPEQAGQRTPTRSDSGDVRPGHDLAEVLVVSVVVSPDDVAADHAALFLACWAAPVEASVR